VFVLTGAFPFHGKHSVFVVTFKRFKRLHVFGIPMGKTARMELESKVGGYGYNPGNVKQT